ncbi:MAG TPA: glycosyltransferase family 39 protein [Polyangiaceae bacterium]|nr:glycosyltransferase family 39 protein [Polyangiaceae bacterium]
MATAEESRGAPAEPVGPGAGGAALSAETSAEPAGAAEAAAATAAPNASPSPKRAWLVPALVAIVGFAVPFVGMCTEVHFRFSVPVGALGLLVGALGLLGALGTYRGDGPVAGSVTLRVLAPRLAEVVGATFACMLVLTLAVAGVLPKPVLTAAILVPLTLLGVVVSVFRLGHAVGAFRDERGEDVPLLLRHGFWLVVLNVVLFVPMLGSYSLSDPWETHYGEVAREMLARDDWISTWWAQDGWFWSKPVLDFWIQALSFSALGVKFMPDQMLAAVKGGAFPQPEWAARMPVFLLTLAGCYAIYRAVRRAYGPRAGFLSGLVLTTMPYWYLIAHQTMTDMPYVGPLAGAMALTLLGFLTDPDAKVRTYEIRVGQRAFRFTAMHLVWVLVIVSAVPQCLYLASRNLTLHLRPDMKGFRFHADEFFAGSGGGNCGIPGNQACTPEHPVHPELFPLKLGSLHVPIGIPIHLAVGWAAVLGAFLWLSRKERRLASAYFLGAWYFLALSMLGKGAPGLVLPIVTALGFVGVTARWKELSRMELVGLVLVVACVGLPWYVQMFMRHGPPFIDRLIMHDMYKRAFVHVHDTNQGDDTSFAYYVWQLGYGLFPWTGLAASGLLFWLRRPDRTKDLRGDTSALMVVWFVAAFGMFTITLTKFHHYILPLVPATAALTAVLVDRMLGPGPVAKDGKLGAYVCGGTLGLGFLVYGILRLFPRTLLGSELTAARSPGLAGLCIFLGLVLTLTSVRRFGSPGEETAATGLARHDASMLAVVGIASAIVVCLCGRDLFAAVPGNPVDGNARLMHLFTYNYGRQWPESLSFRGAFIGFTAVAAVLSLGTAVTRFRKHGAMLLSLLALVWTAWGLDVYLVACAPHWGQRETILAYYRDRRSDQEPFVAYQMNWKGENFYTGNKVPAFVSSGERFKQWVEEQKQKGVKRIYFTSEHGRVGSLKRELGDPPRFVELTDKTLNNKFFLARVDY